MAQSSNKEDSSASGSERRIQHVAAGEISRTSTDAVNGSQLHSVADKLGRNTAQLSAGIASSAAIESTLAYQANGPMPLVLATLIMSQRWVLACVVLPIMADGQSMAGYLPMPKVLYCSVSVCLV